MMECPVGRLGRRTRSNRFSATLEIYWIRPHYHHTTHTKCLCLYGSLEALFQADATGRVACWHPRHDALVLTETPWTGARWNEDEIA